MMRKLFRASAKRVAGLALVVAGGWAFAAPVRAASPHEAAAAESSLVGNVARPDLLYAAVVAAYKSKSTRPGEPNVVRVRAGTYVIPSLPGTDRSATWSFTKENALRNCTIDLSGVTLIFQGITGVNLEFSDCQNVVFRGATVLKPLPSFTQGSIIAKSVLDSDHWYEDVRIDEGYISDPAQLPTKPTVHLFDPKITDKAGRPSWKAAVGGYSHASAVQKTDVPGTIRLIYSAKSMESDPAVGDRVVLRGIGTFTFTVNDCAHVTFANLTLENNGLYGVVEFGCKGTRYMGCKITYGPPPPGGTVPPLVATSADGLHSLYGNPGPDIENCVIEGTPDDCIAIHGAYGTVGDVLPGNVVALGPASFRNTQAFAVGDDMRIQGDSDAYYADARVTDVEKVAEGWHYTLATDLTVKPGYLVANPARCGQGFRIIGNVIRRNRARGMLLKADNGLVEHNLVEDSTIAGIVVSPESGAGEAGYAHNVIIRGNLIRHTGYAENGPWNSQAGGVTVQGNGSVGNKNILIEDNLFDRVIGANLIVRGADGIVIRQNRFVETHMTDAQSGTHFGIDPTAIIDILQSRNVTLTRNSTDGPGVYGKKLISLAPDVSAIRGVQDGITVSPSHFPLVKTAKKR